jgi:hypothetical protein
MSLLTAPKEFLWVARLSVMKVEYIISRVMPEEAVTSLDKESMMEIVQEAQAVGIVSTAFNTPGTLLSDPHFKEREYWKEIEIL